MARVTTTLNLCLEHLYYLTCDPNNDTGYTLEQVLELKKQHGSDYMIEASINHPVPDDSENSQGSQEVTLDPDKKYSDDDLIMNNEIKRDMLDSSSVE